MPGMLWSTPALIMLSARGPFHDWLEVDVSNLLCVMMSADALIILRCCLCLPCLVWRVLKSVSSRGHHALKLDLTLEVPHL